MVLHATGSGINLRLEISSGSRGGTPTVSMMTKCYSLTFISLLHCSKINITENCKRNVMIHCFLLIILEI